MVMIPEHKEEQNKCPFHLNYAAKHFSFYNTFARNELPCFLLGGTAESECHVGYIDSKSATMKNSTK